MKFINNKFYKNPPNDYKLILCKTRFRNELPLKIFHIDVIKYYSASLFASRQCKEIALIRVKSSERLVI